ncbi:MAG: TIGR03936 family radical SAM-associated protein [Desulfitobacteriia bacterium]|jgi:radical SAM-linked protein
MKIRLAYTKKDQAKYIAHLDLARVFARALRRADIAVAFSEGFNPHPKIAFGPPLPVGVEGEKEYVDIELKPLNFGKERTGNNLQAGGQKENKIREKRAWTQNPEEQKYLAEVVHKLQKQLPRGIAIRGYALKPQGSKAITALVNLARYKTEVPFLEEITPGRLEEACQNWLAKEEVLVIRLQKGKQSEKNIRPLVKRIDIIWGEGGRRATFLFDIITGNTGSVRPAEVLASLKEQEGLPLDLSGAQITRMGLYLERENGDLADPLEVIR